MIIYSVHVRAIVVETKHYLVYLGQPKPNCSIGHHTQTFRIIQLKRLSCEHQFIKPVCNLALVKILSGNILNLTYITRTIWLF